MNIINAQKESLQSLARNASALAAFDHLYPSSLTAAGSCEPRGPAPCASKRLSQVRPCVKQRAG